MKTAISIPEEIFISAEKLAKDLRISRSELYSQAVREFIKENRFNGVTEKLNKIYGRESSALNPLVREAQASSIPEEDW